MNKPPELNPVAQVGKEVMVRFVAPVYAGNQASLSLVEPALFVGAATIGAVCFRYTALASEWAYRYPGRYRNLYRPWVAPVGLLALSTAVAMTAPGYMPASARFRPSSWPNWGTLTPETACTMVGFSAIGAGLAGIVLLRRMFREGSVKSLGRAAARWAAWSDVKPHKKWVWSIPIQVHYRGTQRAWGVFSGGRTVLAPSATSTHRHILLVGQSGSGKGFCIFGPIIKSCRTPFVYQDVKGQCPGLKDVRERLGIEPIRWGCAAQSGWASMRWNPLQECREDPSPTDAFAALSAALITGRGDDDWVAKLSRPILAWVLQRGGYQTLGQVQDALVHQGVAKVLGGAGVPQGLVEAMEGKNVKEYLGTTIFSALSCFGSGWGRDVTEAHDFKLDDVCSRGAYVLSAEPEITARTPLVVFWRMFIRKLLRSTKPVPLSLLFDEALAAGKIPSVRDALATLRDREVSIIFGTQHLSGLKEVYGPAEGESLISSFSLRIFLLNGLDPRDRETLSKQLGKRTVLDSTGVPKGSKGRHVEVDLLTMDDLSRRANTEGAFWSVVSGPGVTKNGDPLICRMTGGPKNLISRPSSEELAEDLSFSSLAAQTPPPTTPEVLEEAPKGLLDLASKSLVQEEEPPEDLGFFDPSEL